MCRLEWFNEVYKREPKPPHISRLGGHDYRVVIVVEDQNMNEVEEMKEGDNGKLHYAVVNDSHRRTVKATFVSEATRNSMAFIDPETNSPTRSATLEIIAHRKCHVEEPPTPHQASAKIKVMSVDQPDGAFLTRLATEVENPRNRTCKKEEREEPLTNIVYFDRTVSRSDVESSSPIETPAPFEIRERNSIVQELEGILYEELSKALLSAFPTRAELEMMLRFRLDLVLDNFVAPNDDLRLAVFKLIGKAQAEGWLDRLIAAAHNANRGNAKLFELYQKRGLASIRSDLTESDLERLVRKTNPYLSVNHWRNRLSELESQICRIEIPSSGRIIYGTGFLLAPDVVMTNYHVLETVIVGTDKSEDVVLRFDYKELADGQTLYAGTEYRLLTQDWLISHSPNNRVGELPNSDELDFALLRVDGAPGNQPVGEKAEPNAPQRNWIQLPTAAHQFEPRTPLFILQHPEAKPLKLAFDTDAVIGLNSNNTRVRYTTNTERGSSGSPCFNINWELVALHHSGDPNFASHHQPEYNEGIPFNAILAVLEERNLIGSTFVQS